jgi:hypothetical protein
MRKVDVGGTGFSPEQLVKLIRCVADAKSGGPSSQPGVTLKFGSSHVGRGVSEILLAMLSNSPRLWKGLYLDNCALDLDSLRTILAVLPKLPSLTTLSLSHNFDSEMPEIGAELAKLVDPAAGPALRLKTLYLSGSKKDSKLREQALPLIDALKRNQSLEKLEFNHHTIGPKGIGLFAEALTVNQTLCCIEVDGLGCSDAAALTNLIRVVRSREKSIHFPFPSADATSAAEHAPSGTRAAVLTGLIELERALWRHLARRRAGTKYDYDPMASGKLPMRSLLLKAAMKVEGLAAMKDRNLHSCVCQCVGLPLPYQPPGQAATAELGTEDGAVGALEAYEMRAMLTVVREPAVDDECLFENRDDACKPARAAGGEAIVGADRRTAEDSGDEKQSSASPRRSASVEGSSDSASGGLRSQSQVGPGASSGPEEEESPPGERSRGSRSKGHAGAGASSSSSASEGGSGSASAKRSAPASPDGRSKGGPLPSDRAERDSRCDSDDSGRPAKRSRDSRSQHRAGTAAGSDSDAGSPPPFLTIGDPAGAGAHRFGFSGRVAAPKPNGNNCQPGFRRRIAAGETESRFRDSESGGNSRRRGLGRRFAAGEAAPGFTPSESAGKRLGRRVAGCEVPPRFTTSESDGKDLQLGFGLGFTAAKTLSRFAASESDRKRFRRRVAGNEAPRFAASESDGERRSVRFRRTLARAGSWAAVPKTVDCAWFRFGGRPTGHRPGQAAFESEGPCGLAGF